MNKIVSIRCRRHKRRFNVKEEWLNTCKWLCPKCYGKLSDKERIRYAPKDGEHIEVRLAEAGKPTVLPDIYEEDDSLVGTFIDRRKNNICKEESSTRNEKKTGLSEKLKELLPRCRIQCLKCGENVPCHGFWLEKTKVLCPQCASSMSGEEFSRFNRLHSQQVGEVNKKGDMSKNIELKNIKHKNPIPADQDIVSFGSGCSERFIKKSTDDELREAMRKGKLSKIRYRIEMKRRLKGDWYEGCHEDEERSFGRL